MAPGGRRRFSCPWICLLIIVPYLLGVILLRSGYMTNGYPWTMAPGTPVMKQPLAGNHQLQKSWLEVRAESLLERAVKLKHEANSILNEADGDLKESKIEEVKFVKPTVIPIPAPGISNIASSYNSSSTTAPTFNPTQWLIPAPIYLETADTRPDISYSDLTDPEDIEFIKSSDRIRKIRQNGNWRQLANIGRSNSSKLRVMCVVVRDMKQFVGEWIDFHLITGWDRIVMFDHKSKDGLKEFLENRYPPNVLEYRVASNKSGGYQKMTRAQTYSVRDCFADYWNRSEFLISTDVDEYTYPAPGHWNTLDSLWEAFSAINCTGHNRTVLSTMVCPHFGFGNYTVNPPGNFSFIASYSKRTPVRGLERSESESGRSFEDFCARCLKIAESVCTARENRTNNIFCGTCRLCFHGTPFNKPLYFPPQHIESPKFNLKPAVHTAYVYDKDYLHLKDHEGWTDGRHKGILCNHYRFWSIQHIAEKTQKNGATRAFLKLPKEHPIYSYMAGVRDTNIVQYLLRRRRILAENGIDIF